MNGIVEPREQTWNTDEDSRFHKSKIVLDLLDIPRVVDNGTSSKEDDIEQLSLQDVRQGQIGKHNVLLSELDILVMGASTEE